ncbi:MAG: nucleotidyltransferase domain-containing protein [Pseudorhodoplanes sp.]|nr:MAG: nucleotidyltransferase domain-containing protein [Pseudorhodoplanes sp.]
MNGARIEPTSLRPPDETDVARALQLFAAAARRHYGARLKGLYLFGSRARGDHTPESDVDVAVVLADGDWTFWQEKMRLSDLTYDVVISTGADVQAWPIRESEWRNPDIHLNPSLARAMRRDGRALESPA